MKLLLVEWIDSHAGRGWRSLDEVERCCEILHCRSVGFVVKETKDCIMLAGSISGERNRDIGLCACGDITIPKRAIVRRTTLKAPKVPRTRE